ncbi:MAG: helix-turn-helix transcriptional regulator [Clostridia bacterium]|nr:helix-turn-helix transcriptional regulator [Clostridia bacterium]
MNEYKKEMGLRIKNRRKKLSMTQEEMAEKLNISVKHFSEVERGIAGLSIENLIKVSDVLGLSLDYIIKGEVTETHWESVLDSLKMVPKEKEHLINDLINLGVRLVND